jgi:hypothetical protein
MYNVLGLKAQCPLNVRTCVNTLKMHQLFLDAEKVKRF